jgi:hypothetical protein
MEVSKKNKTMGNDQNIGTNNHEGLLKMMGVDHAGGLGVDCQIHRLSGSTAYKDAFQDASLITITKAFF